LTLTFDLELLQYFSIRTLFNYSSDFDAILHVNVSSLVRSIHVEYSLTYLTFTCDLKPNSFSQTHLLLSFLRLTGTKPQA